jgi:hypothetical protein
MSQINYYTEEGLKKLKDELHEMKQRSPGSDEADAHQNLKVPA